MDSGRCALNLRHPAPPDPQPEAAEEDRDVPATRVALPDFPDHARLAGRSGPLSRVADPPTYRGAISIMAA